MVKVTGSNTAPQNSIEKVGFLKMAAKNAITAFAGGGQTSATPLVDAINRVTTVASAGDSVLLPKAKAGLVVVVMNAAAANSMDVFPTVGDAINAIAVNSQLAVAANKCVIFICAVDGTWTSVLTA